jgi:hypothetical protein
LIVSSLGMTILDLASHIIVDYLQEEYIAKGIDTFNQSLEAQMFLSYFFYATAFLMALIVASSPQLADNGTTVPVTHFQQQPKYPGTLSVQQPYRQGAYQPQPQTQQRY